MASLHIARSGFSPFLAFRSDCLRKLRFSCSNSEFTHTETKVFQLPRISRSFVGRGFRVCCQLKDKENEANGEEPPESLFMKELKRRGMTPTSLLEDSNRSLYELGENDLKLEDGGRDFSKRNGLVSTDFDKSLSNQRERSMALNSEGLEEEESFWHPSSTTLCNFYCFSDQVLTLLRNSLSSLMKEGERGLIPRAKLLLTIGGTFFVGFWPLILLTVAFFSALYFYFGPSFVHDGSESSVAPSPYIDPYQLLEDERLPQSSPQLK